MYFGVSVPVSSEDWESIGHYSTLEEAEKAYDACTEPKKAIVRYDRLGPFFVVGVTIKESE